MTRSNSVPTLFEVRRLHARVDFNGSGALDLAEFVRFMPAGFNWSLQSKHLTQHDVGIRESTCHKATAPRGDA